MAPIVTAGEIEKPLTPIDAILGAKTYPGMRFGNYLLTKIHPGKASGNYLLTKIHPGKASGD
jgi:hypothetical protein